MNEVGPFRVVHDHACGTSAVMHGRDLLDLVRAAGAEGLTAAQAAASLFETPKPSGAEREKARRRLENYCTDGLLVRLDGPSKTSAATYYLAARENS
jgi:replicative DNA helicase